MFKDTNPSATISTFLGDHIIGMCAKERSEIIKFPLQTTCLTSLVIASHAVGSVYSVCYPDGEVLPVALYGIAEQPSGTSKTRVVREMYSGYVDKAIELNKVIAIERESLKREVAAMDKTAPNGAHENQKEDLMNMLDVPTPTTDATPQSLEKVMARYGGFFMAAGTEQNLTDTLLGGLYSDGKGVDGIINSAFNGEHSSTERASNDRVVFHGKPYGGIFCLSQEGTIQTVLNSAGTSGLAERFLMIREDDLIGYRDRYEDVELDVIKGIISGQCEAPDDMIKKSIHNKPSPAFQQYRSKMAELAVKRKNLDDKSLGGLIRLQFEPKAWVIIEAVKSLFEREARTKKISNSFLESMGSKLDILTMKTAATIHVMNTAPYQQITPIPPEVVRSAYLTIESIFQGVSRISTENNLFGESPEIEAVYEYLQRQRKPVTVDNICQSLMRAKNSPFKFYKKRGEGREKIKEALEKAVLEGRVMERKGKNPVYSA